MRPGPGEVVIGIETDRGLFVAALAAAGYRVFAVNPMSASTVPGPARVLRCLEVTWADGDKEVLYFSDFKR